MKWVYCALLIVAFFPLVSAQDELRIELNEQGRVVSYLDTYWVVNVQGEGTIVNPTNTDLFDMRFPFDLRGLTLIPVDSDGEFQGETLFFRKIPANSAVRFSYAIIGITAQNPSRLDSGILYTAFLRRDPKIYTSLFGRLQKAPMERADISGRNARLISVSIDNPASLALTVEHMRVIKTPFLNPNDQLAVWNVITPDEPLLLSTGQTFTHEFLDYDAIEGEVYWLQSDAYISRLRLFDLNNISFFTEQNLTIPLEELNFTNATINLTGDLRGSRFLVRKFVSDTLITPNEPVEITLQLYNFQPTLQEYRLRDILPYGFETDASLEWSGSLPARASISHTYTATLTDAVTAGVDAFPAAVLQVANQTLRSQEVPFIRRFISDGRVYVQKKVSLFDEDTSRITLSVRNLGAEPLFDLTLEDFLSSDAEFSQISVEPERRGLWNIPVLDTDDEWVVSYVTRVHPQLNSLPAVHGVPSESVLRTLILENIVREAWSFTRTRGIEVLGLGVLFGVPILLFLSRRFSWFT